MDDNLGRNDPNRAVLESGRRGIKPSLLKREGDSDGFSHAIDDNNSRANNVELEKLKSAEEKIDGGKGFYRSGETLVDAREEEERAGGFYSGHSRESKGKFKKKNGLFFKRTPSGIIGIIVAIFGLGTVSFTAMIPEVVSWKENLVSLFGQNSAVMNVRSNYLMFKILSGNSNTVKMSSSLANRLKKFNIHYVDTSDADGRPLKMLVYEDSNGRMIPVVATDGDVTRANALAKSGAEVDIDGRRVKLADSSLTLTNARKTNRQFSADYDAATVSFTGKVAGWFDNMADIVLKRIVGDNARKQTDIENKTEEGVDELLYKNRSNGIDDDTVRASNGEETETEDGRKVFGTGNVDVDEDVADGKSYRQLADSDGTLRTNNPSVDAVTSGLSVKAQKAAMLSGTVGCGFLRSIGSISSAVGAMVTLSLRNYASIYLEIADKIKSGDADEVTNLSLNNWSESVKTKAYDIDGNEVERPGSVVSSPGFAAVFAGAGVINENDPSALYVNREYANRNALHTLVKAGSLGGIENAIILMLDASGGTEVYKVCNTLQGVAGAVDGISDVASVFTFGLFGGIKEIVIGTLKGAALAGSITLITSVITAIAPMVASWFADELKNAFLGLNGGYASYVGVRSILDAMLQASTGRYASRENAIELFGLTKNVEEEWAAYERATLSPFDITSKYTFFGSLFNSMIPVINSMDSGMIVSTASSVADLVKSSTLSSMSSYANAADNVNKYAISLASEDNCSSLKSVGVAGDFACGKYSGAYVNELTSVSYDEIYDKMVKYGSFDGLDSYGNPKIKNGSDYAKYVIACVSSDTQPGTMNAAVEGYIEGVQKGVAGIAGGGPIANGIVNFGANFVPFEGFLDVIDAAEQANNFKWNSGAACTGNTENQDVNEMVKTFSMYNLDQRVLYDMEITESNSTVAFLEDYYRENPLDNSIEGQIARVSGLTKEEVVDTLALIEYYDYIANYNPGERYAFGETENIEKSILLQSNDDDSAIDETPLINDIQYADVRNRSFAV